MDVFCPHCLQSVTLEGREPGDYSFDCPECAGEVRVNIPQNRSERPQVRPVRSKPSGHDSKPSSSRSAPAPTGSRASKDSFRASHRKSESPNRAGGRERDAIDFPFEASDGNLVDAAAPNQKPTQDEWDSPEYEVPQPLRGKVKKRTTASKPKRRKRRPDVEFGTYLKWMGMGAAVWLALVVAGVFVPEFGWALIVLGVLTLFSSRGMILRLARDEGLSVWLAVLLVPLYSLFFVLSHFRQTASALVIASFGYGYLISGVVVLNVRDFIDGVHAGAAAAAAGDPGDDEGDEELQKAAAGKMLAGIDSLTLMVDGKETRVPVTQLTCFEANLARGAPVESFEFSGPDVSLCGSFPPQFHGDWTSLLGKGVPIVPKGKQPHPGESRIKLPGRGAVQVMGGKFVISGTMTVGQPVLFGAIELDIAGRQKPETIRGTFMVRVKAGN